MSLRNSLRSLFALALSSVSGIALAEQADPMVIVDRQGWFVRAHLQAGINAVGERDLIGISPALPL